MTEVLSQEGGKNTDRRLYFRFREIWSWDVLDNYNNNNNDDNNNDNNNDYNNNDNNNNNNNNLKKVK